MSCIWYLLSLNLTFKDAHSKLIKNIRISWSTFLEFWTFLRRFLPLNSYKLFQNHPKFSPHERLDKKKTTSHRLIIVFFGYFGNISSQISS